MRFPQDFLSREVLWIGMPFRSGVAVKFSAGLVQTGINPYRKIDAALMVDGGVAINLSCRAIVNVREIGGFQAGDPWGHLPLDQQMVAIAARFTRLRLKHSGVGFELAAYFGDYEPPDISWVYEPILGQPTAATLLCERVYKQPVAISQIPEFQGSVISAD